MSKSCEETRWFSHYSSSKRKKGGKFELDFSKQLWTGWPRRKSAAGLVYERSFREDKSRSNPGTPHHLPHHLRHFSLSVFSPWQTAWGRGKRGGGGGGRREKKRGERPTSDGGGMAFSERGGKRVNVLKKGASVNERVESWVVPGGGGEEEEEEGAAAVKQTQKGQLLHCNTSTLWLPVSRRRSNKDTWCSCFRLHTTAACLSVLEGSLIQLFLDWYTHIHTHCKKSCLKLLSSVKAHLTSFVDVFISSVHASLIPHPQR